MSPTISETDFMSHIFVSQHCSNDTESSEDDDEDAPTANERHRTAVKTRLRSVTALKGTSQQPPSLRMC
jgi:hypothetical protein